MNDSYYDERLCKYYIIAGCQGFIKSYDNEKNVIYNKYYEKKVMEIFLFQELLYIIKKKGLN